MWAALSFAGQYWQLLIVSTLACAVLAYVAFVLRNWRAALAVVGIVVAVLAAQFAYTQGYNAKTDEDVAERTKILQDRLDTLQRLADADRLRADQDAAEIARLTELASKTPANTKPALPADVAKRIGGIK